VFIKAVLPYMHKQQDGLLITISSALARLQLPYLGAYTAAKAAIDVIGTAYHYELNKLGIDSVVIQPGVMSTDIFHNQMNPDNPDAANLYGATGASIKEEIEKIFAESPESPDPEIVANLVGEIIGTPKGQRALWTAIGVGSIQPTVEAMNTSTGDFSKGIQNYLGII
jgi:short-subunit dehydrogenase